MSRAPGWHDRFLDWLFPTQPVSATFVGVRGNDTAWPDLSVSGMNATAERAHGLLQDGGNTSGGAVDALDALLMQSHLQMHVLDAADHRALHHPALLTGEAVFGVISLLLREDRPVDVRAGELVQRLRGLPRFLEEGGAALTSTSEPERIRACRELAALTRLLHSGIEQALRDADPALRVDVRHAADEAADAISAAEELISKLPAIIDDAVSDGRAERFVSRLQHDHQIVSDVTTLREWALAEQARAQDDLRTALAAAGLGEVYELLAALRADQVTADAYDAGFARVWQNAAEHAVRQELLDWPAWPIVFRSQPAWSHGIASDLYRCPPSQTAQVVQEYLYPPLGTGEQAARTLAAVNRAQITLNHVVHHAGLGHHVQNWYAARAASRVGRIAGADTASRILLPCAGTLVEGWACRAPELMDETGFLTPLEHLALLHTRLRLAARAVLDLTVNVDGNHAGAAQAFAEVVGVSVGVWDDEVLRADLHPGSAIMYLLGQRGLERIAADHGQHPAPTGSDRRAYHAAVLSHGAIPVACIAQLMRDVDGGDVRPLTLDELIPA